MEVHAFRAVVTECALKCLLCSCSFTTNDREYMHISSDSQDSKNIKRFAVALTVPELFAF